MRNGTIWLCLLILTLQSISAISQGFENEIFTMEKVNIPGWEKMTEQQLLEREEYAMLNAGRTIDYVAGYNHSSGFPYVLLQSIRMDMSGITPMNNMRSIQKNSELPVFIDSMRNYVKLPPNSGETWFNLKNKCGVTKFDIVLDNEPKVNVSYLLLHSLGHVYMQCFTPAAEVNRNFLHFEEIRQAIKWKVPMQENATSTAPLQQSKTATTSGTSSSLMSWLPWVIGGVILLLVFILLRKKRA